LLQSSTNDQSKILNSSGGFNPSPLTVFNDKNLLSSQQRSNSNILYTGDEVFSSQTINNPDIQSNSSSSTTSLKQYSPAVVRTAPLYISVYTSTPSIPLVKGIVASSTPTLNDDEAYFTRRSPSPQSPSSLKKSEQSSITNPSSNYNKYHHYTSTQQ
ncbi:unnamed protein product, partial [Rotaria sp. Silwood1]